MFGEELQADTSKVGIKREEVQTLKLNSVPRFINVPPKTRRLSNHRKKHNPKDLECSELVIPLQQICIHL